MSEVIHFRMAREEDALASLNDQLERTLEERQLSPKVTFAVQLAVDELVSNILKHAPDGAGGSEILLRLIFDENQVGVEIESEGERFNPFELPEPILDQPVDKRPIGGLGLHLTRTTMDDCQFTYRDGRNIVLLLKKLTADDHTDSRKSYERDH